MCQFFCGILLGYVFIQSHNGMEIYSDGRDFVTSQLASTRNIHGGVFNDWHAPALACMTPMQSQRQTAEHGSVHAQVHRRLEPAGGAPPVSDAAAPQPGARAEAHSRLLLQARPLLRGAAAGGCTRMP
jgi:hypothetical protein